MLKTRFFWENKTGTLTRNGLIQLIHGDITKLEHIQGYKNVSVSKAQQLIP